MQTIDGRGTLDETWWRESLIPYLSNIEIEVASVLYQDLCRIQLAVYHETPPTQLSLLNDITDWSDFKNVSYFFKICISNGRLVDFVADCIELPNEQERTSRWDAIEANLAESANIQRRHSAHQIRMSEFRVKSRETNRLAYDRVLNELVMEGENIPVWKVVIKSTPERLGIQTKMFWRGLQISRCTLLEKRALMHKLNLCQMYSCCPEEILKHIQNVSYELFLASDAVTQTTVKRRWANSFLRALLRRFTKRSPTCHDLHV